jgi:DNA-binding LacI/PurR family transcriptional regulator
VSETGSRRRRGGPTIADVARAAGVSSMTVSNVLNDRSERVSATTRERVRTSLSELGYRVNLSARHLRTGRTGLVGLAVSDFAAGYYAELADRLADRFAEHDLRLVVERAFGRSSELQSLSAARLSVYDGFVLSVVAGDVGDLERLRIDTPVVLIGERTVPDRFDHVLMDNVAGARLATSHLIERGARRIALLGGQEGGADSMAQLRTRGYLEAHRAAGLPVDPALMIETTRFRRRDGYELVSRLLAEGRPFDAVFALTDTTALGALGALTAAGVRVPDDVQLVGFDNLSEGLFCAPTLTTVEPGNASMADAICDLLVDRIAAARSDGGRSRAAGVVMGEATLVERGSTLRARSA